MNVFASPVHRMIAYQLLIMGLLGLSACELAPLQATGVPEERVRAPELMPFIPAADPYAAQLPDGYRAEVVVTGLTYPTSVEFDDQGMMYVAEAGAIYGDPAAPARVLRIAPDGKVVLLADQLSAPITDLLWHNGELYVSHRGRISTIDREGSIRDLVIDLPSLGDHSNNQLTVGPDGKIYFGQGTATNSGVVGVDNFLYGWLGSFPDFHDVPAHDIRLRNEKFITLNPLVLTSESPALVSTAPFSPFAQDREGDVVRGRTKAGGTVLRMNPDGTDLEVFAWGLRNPFGLQWGPDGNLYAADNGFDNRGSRPIANAPDVIWMVREGAWYGWPDYAGGLPVTDPRFAPEGKQEPEFLLAEHPPVEQPLIRLQPHGAACKFDFSTSSRFGYEGQMFLAQVGDMTPITGVSGAPLGFQVVRIDLQNRRVVPFFRTSRDALGPRYFEYAATAGPRRPVDVHFAPDGEALYVVDVGAIAVLPTVAPTIRPFPETGVVWRIVRDGTVPDGPPAGIHIGPMRPLLPADSLSTKQ